jgi:hypothetical protein
VIGLALAGCRKAADAEHQWRAYYAWQTAMLPNLKKPPNLRDFMAQTSPKSANAVRSGGAVQVQTAMAQWRVAMALKAAPPAGRKVRPNRPQKKP